MKVRGSIMPPEWDYTSSAVTIYHRTNIVKITNDDGRIEYEYDEEQMSFSDFENTLYCKQLTKLNSLNGMCSGAIYAGLDINGKHYSFTALAQESIKGLMQEVQQGATIVPYKADGEGYTPHTAEQMTTIAKTMSEWIKVNTHYYDLLKAWVECETDETIIGNIHYGSALPNDLMQTLALQLAQYGIDITKYASMLGG